MNEFISAEHIAVDLQEYLAKAEGIAHLRPHSDQEPYVEPEQTTIFDLLGEEAANDEN
ncbi:hypothetical protein ACS3QZ_20015 (plasmid) [Shimia sp. W99]